MAVDFNIEIRKKQLESLDQFVTCSREKVQSVLNDLGWSVEKIQEEQRLFVKCPYDHCHKIPAEKIDDHTDKCKVKSAGYDLQEEFTSEPDKQFEGNNIKIDINKKIEILCQAVSQNPYFRTDIFFLLSRNLKISIQTLTILVIAWNGKDPDPQTYSRLVSTFSSDERLVLYDYSVGNTKGHPELPEFDTSVMMKEKGDSTYTKKALMSFERDIKRRSVKYKPVHTNHKNYKEVLRDVIDGQMQQYNDWLEQIKGLNRPHTPDFFSADEPIEEIESGSQNKCLEYIDRPHSSVSKLSNNSSGSHSTRQERRSKNSRLDESVKNHHNKEYHSNYSTHNSKSRYKYSHQDEHSQESSSVSKVSSIDMDISCETYETTSRTHSRDSSIHSSYRYKDKHDTHKDGRRHKLRGDGRDWKKRDHSSGSSKHSSRSHRSKEDKTHRHYFKEKSRNHKNSHRDT